jgi:hypothetical protein
MLGLVVGSLFFLTPAYVIWHFLLIKHIWREPVTSRVIASVAAYVSLAAISFGGTPAHERGLLDILGPLPGAIILGIFVVWRIKKVLAMTNDGEVFR